MAEIKLYLDDMISLVVNILKKVSAEDLKNSFVWLQNYRPQ